jgi:hypothetical protein
MLVAVSATNVAGLLPKYTADAVVKFVPLIVTDPPPAVDPDAGLTFVTVGAAGGGGGPVT